MEKDSRTAYALADLTRAIRYDELPSDVVHKAKELIVDSVACMIGGVKTIQGEKIIRLYTSMQGVPEVGVYGTSEKIPALNAIYVNSYLATVLDYDDTYDGHPGSTVVPVALSLGQLKDISGKKLIESVAAGYEIGIRVSNGIKASPERIKKVRGINTWQIFCAAAAAARLLDLGREETAHGYGHAAIHASVPSLRKWGFIDGRIQWLKNNFGWTSYGGVLSMLLAQDGFVADTTIFDGEDGFWIMASSDQCNYEAIKAPLDTYHIHSVHTKPYTACRHIHPTLDAISQIVQERRPRPEEVERIDIHTFYEVVNDYVFLPATPFDVVFSAPYLAALVMHEIPPGPDWFREDLLRDGRIIDTARKVVISDWEEASRLYPLVNRELMSKAEVTMKSGEVLKSEIRIPKGDPRRPMTEEEFRGKFAQTCGAVLGAEKSDRIYGAIMTDLENLESVRVLTDLMSV